MTQGATVYSDSIKIIVKDSLKGNSISISNYFDEESNLFNSIVYNNKPTVITDMHWKNRTTMFVPFFLDSISLVKDLDGFWVAKSHNEDIDLVMNFDVDYRRKIDPIKIPEFFHQKFLSKEYILSPDKRNSDIENHTQRKYRYLEHYFDENKLQLDSLKEVWKEIIFFEGLRYHISLGDYKVWPRKYLQELVKKGDDFNNDYFLFVPSYRASALGLLALNAFLNYGDSPSLGQYAKEIDRLYEGKTREYLLFTILMRSKNRYSGIVDSRNEYNAIAQEFLSNAETYELKKYLRKDIEYSQLDIKNIQLVNIGQETIEFKDLISKYSFTYIDFWASWCAPCKEEIPASISLSNRYLDRDIGFAYISIDERASNWERASKQMGISEKGYLAPGGKKSIIAKKFNVKEIPRYIILDRNGKVINIDAPRPSDPEIDIVLNKLLER